MKIEVGGLIAALKDWTLCIDGSNCDCTICVELPRWAEELGEREKVYLALYLAARHILDYRLVAAMHVYMVRNRVALRPEVLVEALRDARVRSRVSRVVEDSSPFAWEAVFYRGLVYARQVLSLDKPVLVKVEPPSGKRKRERLRVLLEGKRVSVRGRTYHVGGLIRMLGGERIAPWIYLVPRRNLPELLKRVGSRAQVIRLDCY